MQARVGQHQTRMIQSPFPPEEKIQIQGAWTPLQLKIAITPETPLKLMQLREQLKRGSLRRLPLHSVAQHHGIAVIGLAGRPTDRGCLNKR